MLDSLTVRPDTSSGRAQTPAGRLSLNANLYNKLHVEVKWRAIVERETVIFTFVDHGCNRDCFEGDSSRGGLILKFFGQADVALEAEPAL